MGSALGIAWMLRACGLRCGWRPSNGGMLAAALVPQRCPAQGALVHLRRSRTALRAQRGSRDIPYIDLEEVAMAEPIWTNHESKLDTVVAALSGDGMGVIPTDTQHAYVARIGSKRGSRRIYDVKGIRPEDRKPLSILCSDVSMAAQYCDLGSLPRSWFQSLKRCLPGPYTFILRATSNVPRLVFEDNPGKRLWERREVGIRVPACGTVKYITDQLGPLLASSACSEPSEMWESQRNKLDFIVTATDISVDWEGIDGDQKLSTIVDLTAVEPILIRQGLGDASMFFD